MGLDDMVMARLRAPFGCELVRPPRELGTPARWRIYDANDDAIASVSEREEGYARLIVQALNEHFANEEARLRAALERITQSHPSLVLRNGGPAPWLVAKAALLNIPLGDGYEELEQTHDAVVAEWAKTEPRVRRR